MSSTTPVSLKERHKLLKECSTKEEILQFRNTLKSSKSSNSEPLASSLSPKNRNLSKSNYGPSETMQSSPRTAHSTNSRSTSLSSSNQPLNLTTSALPYSPRTWRAEALTPSSSDVKNSVVLRLQKELGEEKELTQRLKEDNNRLLVLLRDSSGLKGSTEERDEASVGEVAETSDSTDQHRLAVTEAALSQTRQDYHQIQRILNSEQALARERHTLLTAEVDDCRRQMEILRDESSELMIKNHTLRQQLSLMEDKNSFLVTNGNRDLTEAEDALEKERALTASLRETVRSLDDRAAKVEELERDLITTEREQFELRQEHEELLATLEDKVKQRTQELESALSDAEVGQATLLRQLTAAQQALDQEMDTVRELKMEIEELRGAASVSKAHAVDVEAQYSQACREQSRLRGEARAHTRTIEELNRINDTLLADKATLLNRLAETEENTLTLEQRLAHAEQTLQARAAEYEMDLQANDHEMEMLQAENIRLSSELKKMKFDVMLARVSEDAVAVESSHNTYQHTLRQNLRTLLLQARQAVRAHSTQAEDKLATLSSTLSNLLINVQSWHAASSPEEPTSTESTITTHTLTEVRGAVELCDSLHTALENEAVSPILEQMNAVLFDTAPPPLSPSPTSAIQDEVHVPLSSGDEEEGEEEEGKEEKEEENTVGMNELSREDGHGCMVPEVEESPKEEGATLQPEAGGNEATGTGPTHTTEELTAAVEELELSD
eukprot:GCRY01004092.1.p1 GENE.GCRY01004092.1~~GCRY01004092.1.p1  ORF type:complete len:771 (-),score=219.02 GCRY01004092.1:364-2544(-)